MRKKKNNALIRLKTLHLTDPESQILVSFISRTFSHFINILNLSDHKLTRNPFQKADIIQNHTP